MEIFKDDENKMHWPNEHLSITDHSLLQTGYVHWCTCYCWILGIENEVETPRCYFYSNRIFIITTDLVYIHWTLIILQSQLFSHEWGYVPLIKFAGNPASKAKIHAVMAEYQIIFFHLFIYVTKIDVVIIQPCHRPSTSIFFMLFNSHMKHVIKLVSWKYY